MAIEFEAKVIRGEVEKMEKPVKKILFCDLLSSYEPWVKSNRRSWQETMNMIRSTFGFLMDRPVSELSVMEIEKWRMERLQAGRKASSVNRFMASLQAVLNWGVKHDLIESNPLSRLEHLREHDSDVKVRYLSDAERSRLMDALDAREKRIRGGRENHNGWLSERHRGLMPALSGEYADYLKPMVLLSLHTGMRQGNLFSLLWGDVDLETCTVTLRASVTKAGKTLRSPLNSVAVEVLTAWRKQSANMSQEALVFPSPKSGGILSNVKKAWTALLESAQIENFRWHDMRHDFASQLVMKGVDLNVVRELLGHADMKMTMRYAHLAPGVKLRAVELLTSNENGKMDGGIQA
jgi:integrase